MMILAADASYLLLGLQNIARSCAGLFGAPVCKPVALNAPSWIGSAVAMTTPPRVASLLPSATDTCLTASTFVARWAVFLLEFKSRFGIFILDTWASRRSWGIFNCSTYW